MVARWNTKIPQPAGGKQVEQLAPRFDCLKPEHDPILEQRLSVAASRRSDQDPLYDVPGIPLTRMDFGRLRVQMSASARTVPLQRLDYGSAGPASRRLQAQNMRDRRGGIHRAH